MMAGLFSSLLGRTAVSRFGGGAIRGVRRGALPFGLGAGGGFLGSALGGGDDVVPRRRRRKALTNDDVRTALTIASAISKKAAENFILMRVRGQ